MPITQERMKQLITAAESVVSAYISHCASLGEFAAQFRAGTLELETLLDHLAMKSIRPDADIATEIIAINRESTRWTFTHNKNEQEARRIARRRAEARGEEYTGAPTRARVYKKGKAGPSSGESNNLAEMHRASAEKEITQDSALDFDTGPGTAGPKEEPFTYVPGELSPETKAKIDQFNAEQEAKARVEELVKGLINPD